MPLTLRLEATEDDAVEQMPEDRVIEASGVLTIGRGAGNGIVLEDRLRSISKRHCEIRQAGGIYEVIDCSRNGTFLNDHAEPLPRDVAVPLRAGDRLRIGCFTLLVLAAQAEAPAEAAPRMDADSGSFAPAAMPSEPWREDDAPPRDAMFGDDSLRPPPSRPPPGIVDSDAPMLAQAFARPRPQSEPIPDNWDIAAELGLPKPPRPPGPKNEPPVEPLDQPPARPPEPPPRQPRAAPREDTGAQATGRRARGREIDPEEAQRALQAFLQGCSLSVADLGTIELETAMRRAGEALRNAITGLHEMLGVRSSSKQSFGVELTMIGQFRNNPLKYLEDGNEALRAVMVTEMPGFLTGGEMVEEALHDIKRHQIAMITAMRAGLANLCQQLAPETIERGAGLPPRPLRWARPLGQARCWAHYLTVFDEITAALDNDSMRVFGDGFARAYADVAKPPEGRAGDSGHV